MEGKNQELVKFELRLRIVHEDGIYCVHDSLAVSGTSQVRRGEQHPACASSPITVSLVSLGGAQGGLAASSSGLLGGWLVEAAEVRRVKESSYRKAPRLHKAFLHDSQAVTRSEWLFVCAGTSSFPMALAPAGLSLSLESLHLAQFQT